MSYMPPKHVKTDRFANAAKTTAADECAIQKNIDRKESRRRKTSKKTGAMQAGARRYPTPPMPKQHIAKPGKEASLDLAPMYDAPHYKGSEKLKDAKSMAKFGGDTPMKRPAQPEEIAPAFVFLAAPSCSSYITGEILPIIGGYSGG
jgi:Enoyl-(Acyl carrier protein) reductase